MKIYFSGSIRGGRDDFEIYGDLVAHLKTHGEVLTEHIGNPALTSRGDQMNVEEIHDRDMRWISESDLVVAEVTNPSLGVGYEIGRTVERNGNRYNQQRILCLYREEGKPEKRLSAMIDGCMAVTVERYSTIDEAKKIIDSFILR
jgi:hypothetical protein